MESELARYDWNSMQEDHLKIEVLATNSRSSMLGNSLMVVITDESYVSKRLEMFQSMFEHYSEHRFTILSGQKALQNVKTEPGHHLVLFDRHRCLDSEGKFVRVRINKILHQDKTNDLMDKFEGELIDLGETAIFCRYELYNLDDEYRTLPPQVFRVRLKSLKAFEGSTRLARSMDMAFLHHGYAFRMKITAMPKIGDDLVQVDFILENIGMTLSEYIGLQFINLSTMETMKSLRPAPGTVFDEVYLTNISSDGKIFVQVGSRIFHAVKYCLEEAEDIFEVCKLVQENEVKNLIAGHVCLAQCPYTSSLERCQIQSIKEETQLKEMKCTVAWMDVGGVSEMTLDDLVDAEFFSPILKHAPSLGSQFQLYNIQVITASLEDIFDIIPSAGSVSMGIESIPSNTNVKVRPPPLVLLYKDHQKGRDIINELLIDARKAIPLHRTASYLVPSIHRMRPNSFWEVPYHSIASEWMDPDHLQFLKHPALAVGQKIIVSVCTKNYSGPLKFVVRPFGSANFFNSLQESMTKYFTDYDWARKETQLCQTLEVYDQHFYIYDSHGVYSRAKIVNFIDLPMTGDDSPLQEAEICLIDEGVVVIANLPSIYRVVNPWPLLTSLGPQGAVAMWKRAKDVIIKDGKDSYYAKQEELAKTLQKLIGNGKKIKAVVSEIRYDHYGRTNLVLDFDV